MLRAKFETLFSQFNWSSNHYFVDAAANGNIETVTRMIHQGIDVNIVCQESYTKNDDRTALIAAIVNGHIEIVRLLLEHNANVNYFDSRYAKSPLMWAIWSKNETNKEAIIKLLLDAGADVNAVQSKNYWTALMMAVNHAPRQYSLCLMTSDMKDQPLEEGKLYLQK